MTRMLASVSNCFEVDKLLNAGVDIIDLKDPSRGALGAVSVEIARKVVKHVNHSKPVSATIGDLVSPAEIDSAIQMMSGTGVDIIKVGIFGTTIDNNIFRVLESYAVSGIDLVLVFFADEGLPTGDFDDIASAGIRGVMLDTANKQSGSLPTILDSTQMHDFVDRAHRKGLWAGLAGSLRALDISNLLTFNPDYLGFRGAICHKNMRNNAIDLNALYRIRQLIPVQTDELATSTAS